MPHDTAILAILAMLIYIFVPQFFGYAAIALVLRLGFPAMRVVWQTTRDIREFPESEDEEGKKAEKGEDKAADETEDFQSADEKEEGYAAEASEDQNIPEKSPSKSA